MFGFLPNIACVIVSQMSIDSSSSALDLRTSNLGPDHRKTANAARSLGIAKYLLNRLEDASYYLQEYVRITEFQPDHRKANEYLIVLIMLSDIQEATGRQKLGRKILVTARETCQRDPLFEEEFPHLRRIVEKRLSGFKLSTRDLDGRIALNHDEEELDAFRALILTDD